MECARPAVVEGERLGEGLANDVACFVGKEELRVEGDDLDCDGGALGGELGIEGFKVKEDCLFGFLQFLCALAGNGDENEMFWFHIECFLRQLVSIGSSINVNSRIEIVWVGRMHRAHWQPETIK